MKFSKARRFEWFTFPTVFVLAISVIAAVVVGYCYHHQFGKGAELSSDPAVWGQFGDYFGGLLNPFLGLLNVALVAIIAFNLGRVQRSLEGRRSLLQMSRDWNSKELYEARGKSFKFLCRAPPEGAAADGKAQPLTLRQIHNEFLTESTDLWMVLGFFTDLKMAIDQDLVREDEALDYFARIFTWWDVFAVQEGYPEEWPSAELWNGMRSVIQRRFMANAPKMKERKDENGNAIPAEHPLKNTDYGKWLKYASDELNAKRKGSIPQWVKKILGVPEESGTTESVPPAGSESDKPVGAVR